jgi:flagellar basal-body rod modification protein FlgD
MATIGTDVFKGLGLATVEAAAPKKQTLGQEQFLKLMTTQLTHQDPSKPMENGDFLAQMAQFGTVSGIQDLQKAFGDFASSISSGQALQASNLVGRSVSVSSNEFILPAGGEIKGQLELPDSSPNVGVNIIDARTGETIRHLDLGEHSAGAVPFTWDGYDENKTISHMGAYKIEAVATIDGKNTALATEIHSKVESVSLGNAQQGIRVNLPELGPVNFNQIKQIL